MDSSALTTWILTDARRLPDPGALIVELIARLDALAGRPALRRVAIGSRILHPQYRARQYTWRRGQGIEEEDYGPRDRPINPAFYTTPVAHLEAGAPLVRQRLEGPDPDQDYPLSAQLRDEGVTDYLALPLPFGDGQQGFATWSCDRPGGFTDAEVAALTALALPLSAVCELLIRRQISRVLMDTYIGRMTGARVLDGSISRGAREAIEAVIWFCDLRGFTALSERLSPDALLAILDGYFEHVVGAVHAGGGEVLKFMGDGMLAIFPVAGPADEPDVCRRALAAARDARARVGVFAAAQRASGGPEVDFGLALHIGQVIYGNVGAPDRLDFTVIGPGVNRASRMEGLCRVLGEPILVSTEVARHLPEQTRSAGLHPLKGVAAPVEVFALR